MPPVRSATAWPRSSGWHRSSVPWMTSTGHSMLVRIASTSSLDCAATAAVVVQQDRLGAGLHGPADGVLDLLGRVRLAEQLVEEEAHVAVPVLEPVVPVLLVPALVHVENGIEVTGAGRVRGRDEGCPRRDADHTEHALGMRRRGDQGPPAAGAQTDEDGLVDAELVHHRDRVVDEHVVGVGGDVGRSVGQAVATAVDRHHPEVLSEVRHLRLPGARVHHRVDGGEDDGQPPLAEGLVADLDTVTVDQAGDVGIPRAHGTHLSSGSRAGLLPARVRVLAAIALRSQ